MSLTQQEIDEQIAQDKEVKKRLIDRKRVLEIQEAQQGNNALPHIVTEIKELTEKISACEANIARLKALVTTSADTSSIRILYVEDVHEYAKRYRELLHAHFGPENVKWVETARAALHELTIRPPDVMVADLFIPKGPDYMIPIEAEDLPRYDPDESISYDYGADICAVALQKRIPIVALSTAPIRHAVREPIEQARRKYGGNVYHLDKHKIPDETQLISAIRESYSAPSEAETLSNKLQYWIEDRWLNTSDLSARMAILNDVRMALENASQPAITLLQTNPVGQTVRNLIASLTVVSDQERKTLTHIKQQMGLQ